MNFTVVLCPRCGRRLTVSVNAPRIVTCPNCLGVDREPQEMMLQILHHAGARGLSPTKPPTKSR